MTHPQYPEVLIPSIFNQIKTASPPLPPEPSPPDELTRPERIPWRWLVLSLVVGLLASLFLKSWAFIFIIPGLISLFAWFTYPARLKTYHKLSTQLKEQYQRESDRYHRQVSKLNSPEAIEE